MKHISRRQSVNLPNSSAGSEFGSMAVASEQACRMLRTFRGKVASTVVERGVNWDEVENELVRTLEKVRERRMSERYRAVSGSESATSADVTGLTVETGTDMSMSLLARSGSEASDVESLRVLMERSSVADEEAVGGEIGTAAC